MSLMPRLRQRSAMMVSMGRLATSQAKSGWSRRSWRSARRAAASALVVGVVLDCCLDLAGDVRAGGAEVLGRQVRRGARGVVVQGVVRGGRAWGGVPGGEGADSAMGGGLVEGAGERDGAAEGAGEALVGSREVGGGGGGGRGLGSGGLGGLLREGAGEGGADLDQLVQDRAVVGRVRAALARLAGAASSLAGSEWEGGGGHRGG